MLACHHSSRAIAAAAAAKVATALPQNARSSTGWGMYQVPLAWPQSPVPSPQQGCGYM